MVAHRGGKTVRSEPFFSLPSEVDTVPSPEPRDRIPTGPLVLAVLVVVVLLYSVLIVQELLFGVVVAAAVFVVYLLWRLVRATERIADAVEHDE